MSIVLFVLGVFGALAAVVFGVMHLVSSFDEQEPTESRYERSCPNGIQDSENGTCMRCGDCGECRPEFYLNKEVKK
jgi:hypothetical protein